MVDFLMFGGLFLIFIALPASIVATIVFAVKKKRLLFPAICIPISIFLGILFLARGSFLYSQTDEYKQTVKINEKKEESKKQIKKKKEVNVERQKKKETVKKENKKTNKKANKSKKLDSNKTKKKEKKKEELNSIFYGEIGIDINKYKGKEVIFSFKCDYSREDKTEEITTPSNLCYGGISVKFKDKQRIKEEEYYTVKGIVNEDNGETLLEESVVVCNGEDAKKNYQKEFENWIKSFQDAECVTYDNLLRYPETYYNKKIKIDLDITEVETDGAIFNGTITGVVPGTENKIAVYDYRENREPRIKTGDKITIYALGNKTITIKVKDGKTVFSKTIEEYDIPCVYLQNFDFR